jgi:MoaA/NifB/PqqE/SkfB family radical SAM enzyme
MGMPEPEINTKVIDQRHKQLTYITYSFQGEPYLNKDFTDMVSYATKHNIYSATSTNAHYLTDANCKKTIESGLSRRIISIDGVSQESYGQYRIGGNLDKMIDGTKNIVKWKKVTGSKTPFIIGSL